MISINIRNRQDKKRRDFIRQLSTVIIEKTATALIETAVCHKKTDGSFYVKTAMLFFLLLGCRDVFKNLFYLAIQ